MRVIIKTKSGNAEIAANDPGVVPGVVRVKVGMFPVFFSPDEAREIGREAINAAQAADEAKAAE